MSFLVFLENKRFLLSSVKIGVKNSSNFNIIYKHLKLYCLSL